MSNPKSDLDQAKDVVGAVESLLQSWYSKHAEFNTIFDKDRLLKVKSRIPGREPYEIAPSEALFWSDRATYEDERKHWENERAEENKRFLSKTLDQWNLRPHLLQLTVQAKRQRVVPFVGAGMSCYMCPGQTDPLFPLWPEAVRQIAAQVSGLTNTQSQKVKEAIGSSKLIDAAQLLWVADEVQVSAYIKSTFDKNKSTNAGVHGPVKLLGMFARGCVITTNYDSVLEQCVGPFAHVHAGRDNNSDIVARIASGEKCLIKLHGDAPRKETYVFSRDHYDEAYKDAAGQFDYKKPLPRSLRQLYTSHSLLFLGCGLDDDWTLSLFHTVVQDKSFDIPDHYAILPSPNSKRARNAKASRLNGLNIRPIWYPPDKHEFVAKYLQLVIDHADGMLTQL